MSAWTRVHSDTQIQQSIVNMRSCGNAGVSFQAIRTTGAHPVQSDWSRPQHNVTERFLTFTDDMKPDATLLIGLSYYVLERQTSIR